MLRVSTPGTSSGSFASTNGWAPMLQKAAGTTVRFTRLTEQKQFDLASISNAELRYQIEGADGCAFAPPSPLRVVWHHNDTHWAVVACGHSKYKTIYNLTRRHCLTRLGNWKSGPSMAKAADRPRVRWRGRLIAVPRQRPMGENTAQRIAGRAAPGVSITSNRGFMVNNEILRMLRNLLEADAAEIAEIARLSGSELDAVEVEPLLRRRGEPGWRECSDAFLAQFLDGLVIHQRGRDDSRPPRPIETPVTNNMVLKKLRVAFELHEEDMHAILEAADVALSKAELNALFRKPDNKHYRACSDEVLEAFIEGLAMIGWDEGDDDVSGS